MSSHISLPSTGRVTRSMVGMLFYRFGGQGLTFLIVALLARHLGPEQFGLYSTLTVFIGFCAILLAPGLNDLLIRESFGRTATGSDNVLHPTSALGTGYALRLLLAASGIFLAVVIGPLLGWEGISTGLIALSGVSLLTSLAMPSYRMVYDVPYQLDYRMDRAAGINLSGRIILLTAFVIGILSGANLTGIVTAQISGEVFAFFLLLFLLKRDGYPISPEFNFTSIKAVAILASPLLLSEALTVIYTRLDVLLLSHFIDAREAGIFTGPIRIIDGLQIIPTVFLASLIPSFNRINNHGSPGFQRALKLSSRLFWACGIICAVTISPFSSAITGLFLGAEYSASIPILRIGVFCAPLVFIGGLFTAAMIVAGYQKTVAKVYFCVTAFSVSLNLILIPGMGATGAIIGKLATYAAVLAVALFWSRSREIGLPVLIQGFVPYALAITAAYFLNQIKLPVWWGLPAVLVVATSLVWYSGWFGDKQLQELKSIITGSQPNEK